MLWLNPAGAQQLTQKAAEKVAGFSMDKGVALTGKNSAVRQNTDGKLEKVSLIRQSDLRVVGQSQFSDEQKNAMVKAYMQNAMAQTVAEDDQDQAQAPASKFIASISNATRLFEIKNGEVGEPTLVTALQTSSAYAYPFWGAWCDDHYEAMFVARTTSGGLSAVGYYSYDPLTGRLSNIGLKETSVLNSAMADYDPVDGQIYTLYLNFNQDYTAIESITVYKGAPSTGTFESVGTLSGLDFPVAMAIDKTGEMYVICADGKLYSVDKTSWTATAIGETGVPTDTYNQSAAVDYRTQTLYWMYIEVDPETGSPVEAGVATVNTNTAAITKIEPDYYQTMQVASVYYTDQNPLAVDPFGLAYDAGEKQVVATFVAPELTVNGESLTELKAIHIYSAPDGTLGDEVGKIDNPVPGKKYELAIELTDEEGTLTYAARAEDMAGVFSSVVFAEVMILDVELPYTNGFEDDEDDMMANVTFSDPLNNGGLERTDAEAHTGDYSYKLTSNYDVDGRILNFEAFPVQKGGVYAVSFYAKSGTAQNIFLWFNDNLQGYRPVKTDWEQQTVYYTAETKGQLKFSLCAISTDPIYIDDVEVKEFASPNVPGELTINAVSPAESNALAAVLNITLPSLAVSDEPLASIEGIVVQYAEDASFADYETDTVKTGITVGGTADFTAVIKKAGQYNFRAYAYNEFGPCPNYTVYANRSAWIGPKNMPVSMALAEVNDEGKAEITWTAPAVADEISWTVNGKLYRRLTIDGETAFKYAQSYDAADLAAYGLVKPKALQMGFVPGSETAEYTLVLAYDGTEELVRKQIDPSELERKAGEWYWVTIDEDIEIDITKELWAIVEVAESENQGYACAVTSTTAASGKSNRMFHNGKWSTIDKLFSSVSAGSVLVSIKAEDVATAMEPDNGYKVYRGNMDADFEDYELITENPVTERTYTDQDWTDLTFGRYMYAVVAAWEDEDATPTMTNILNKDMEMQVTFVITSDAGSTEGAAVAMLSEDEAYLYTALADAEGKVVFDRVWRNKYDYEVVLPYHEYYSSDIDLVEDVTIDVELTEVVVDPTILDARVEGKDIVLEWGVNPYNWEDDVESYEDFAIENIGEYILSEPVLKGGIQGTTWTNAAELQSWIVFNPGKTTPEISSVQACSGEKMFVAWFGLTGQNNDYLIRSVEMGGGVFTFYCRAYMGSYPEAFEVVYSSTTADLSAFKTIQAYNRVSVTAWTPVSVEIPADAKFIGLRCTSDDAFGFMVDDLTYYIEQPANPIGYEVYLDGEKVEELAVNVSSYTFEDLEAGEHKVGVKAVYASRTSSLVERTLTVSDEATPIKLVVEVEETSAVLTWEMPEGFAPTSYKVYLGEELKAENITETTYTFTDLEEGEYTAAVVAVYPTGESEKATVSFKIEITGVESVDMAQTRIYPNPNNGMFYLTTEVAGMVEVYALNGQKLRQAVVPGAGTYAFDLNRARGMYLVKFVSGNNTRIFKVVVR